MEKCFPAFIQMLWFVNDGIGILETSPRAPLVNVQKAKAPAKDEGKGRGKGGKCKKMKKKGNVITPEKVPKAASFRRKFAVAVKVLGRSKGKHSMATSSMATSSMATPLWPPHTRSRYSYGSSVYGSSSMATPSTQLMALTEKLTALGLPVELLPTTFPRGGKSYTIVHPTMPGSVQVLHARGMFVAPLTVYPSLAPLTVRGSVTWSQYPSVAEAWAHCKLHLGW